jgi:excisionase family DNA binding protein
MEELLTTRQVQELLKVDRITIYRMLQDGRLKGVKIGQQWRFPRSKVEKLLSSGSASSVESAAAAELTAAFPAHCVQPVQDLFAEVSGLSAIILDVEGEPQTEISNPCDFCRLLWKSDRGRAACLQNWREFARQAAAGENLLTCHAGLSYWVHPVMENSKRIGWFITGGCLRQSSETAQQRLEELSQQYDIPFDLLQDAFEKIPRIPPDIHSRVNSWPAIAARAVEGILRERTSFIERLQQIANLTQIS